MRVLYLNPDRGIPILGDKGASVHVREFVNALARQNHQVALICASLGSGNAPPTASVLEVPPTASDADLARECALRELSISALDEQITRREIARLHYDRNFVSRVMAVLDDTGFRPDLIYERYALFHSQGAALARTLGVPRILEVNAPLIEEQERFRGLALKAVAAESERASFDGADAIVAVSNEVASYINSLDARPRTVLVIPNGVDVSRFHPNAGGRELRVRLGLGTGPVIGFVGSFKPWHGSDFLIDAFARMARADAGVRLLCVGEGPELEPARRKIALLGLQNRVVLTGRVPHADVPAYLDVMDVSVAPYVADSGFYFSPLKVVEALAMGTPVVATRLGQLRMLVQDGVTGLLFNPGDQADFCAKVMGLIGDDDRRRAMSAVARRRALAEFSWLRVAARAMTEGQRLIDLGKAA